MADRRGISDRMSSGDLRSLYERTKSTAPPAAPRSVPEERKGAVPAPAEPAQPYSPPPISAAIRRPSTEEEPRFAKATYYIREDQADWLAEMAFRERKLRGGRGISELVRQALDLLREVEEQASH